MSEFDAAISDCANGTIYERYVLDILRTVNPSKLDDVLTTCDKMHRNPKFTSAWNCLRHFVSRPERRYTRDLSLSVSWWKKLTDTNIILNYYSLAPAQYKNASVRWTIHRLFQITSDLKNFEDLGRAKKAFEANQYPPSAYNLITDSLNRILGGSESEQRKKNPSVPQTILIYSTVVKYRTGWSQSCRQLIILESWMWFSPLGNFARSYHL